MQRNNVNEWNNAAEWYLSCNFCQFYVLERAHVPERSCYHTCPCKSMETIHFRWQKFSVMNRYFLSCPPSAGESEEYIGGEVRRGGWVRALLCLLSAVNHTPGKRIKRADPKTGKSPKSLTTPLSISNIDGRRGY